MDGQTGLSFQLLTIRVNCYSKVVFSFLAAANAVLLEHSQVNIVQGAGNESGQSP